MAAPRPAGYRTAIVGAGSVAAAHAEAIAGCGDRARLRAVVDIAPDRAVAFARRWSVPRTYPDLAALLRSEELDLVQLCTPPEQHASQALACLAAGVTALVEKPPTRSLAEFADLVEAERRSTAHIATVFQHRFGAAAVRLRAMTAAGTLGRPLLATCATQWYRDDEYYAVPWRGSWEREGGGPTMGHGIHQFDLLLSVLGPWREVTAVAVRGSRRIETEDISMALVTFPGGTVASVVNSVVSPRQTSALRFDYEYATVEVDHLYGYTDDDWTLTPAPGHEALARTWGNDADPGTGARSGHASQFAAVLDALDRGEQPPVTLVDAGRTMEFIAALYASAFTGERVRAGELDTTNPFFRRMDGTGAPWRRAGVR
jgi:predicted dehydrogenase